MPGEGRAAGSGPLAELLPLRVAGGCCGGTARSSRVWRILGVAVLVPLALRSATWPRAFARKVYMPVPEAWRTLGVRPDSTKGEIKRAFRQKIKEVHPDVTGDDGTMLQRVRDAFAVLDSLRNPTAWDAHGVEDGLPAWASGLLRGVEWSKECPSYAAFLGKPDQKALAIGEFSEKSGVRPWAAVWGKYSQQEANAQALRICRQNGGKCRLVYVGSGSARVRQPADPTAGRDEREWWGEMFQGGGDMPGFGWLPLINPDKEMVIGYKTVTGGDRSGAEQRVRVPVFRLKTGGLPYYYSPLRPREKIHMQKSNFKHVRKRKVTSGSIRHDSRLREIHEASGSNFW
mmetsp:Transcript_74468/g.230102  ORF Transcript_74468/g.230102 Transcript_74468/m.230102 type:complete len:344 (-) Transcript_74468:49-1080(-)